MRRYTVILTPDPEDGGYTVRVPALPGCNTQGDTIEEAIALYVETLEAAGEPIPEELEVRPKTPITSISGPYLVVPEEQKPQLVVSSNRASKTFRPHF